MKTEKVLTDNELQQVTGGVSNGRVNWPLFGKIILEDGGDAIPALNEMVAAIRKNNWSCVAELARKPAIKSLPIVSCALGVASA